MCAIIGSCGKAIPRETFLAARDAMRHRGPDDAGEFFDPAHSVSLGHRRLSILDLSAAGHQPMASSDGRYQIVFNGEIFNYVELKKELAGYPFRSTSDTEVLLAAYAKWGKECLKKFNGQFAFAIYDTQDGNIFAARDHFGIKPFYYAVRDNAFLFASEIKGLLALGVPARPNERIIYEYLQFGLYDHSEDTFFDGIKALPAGHFLEWKNGRLHIASYWDLSRLPAVVPRSGTEAGWKDSAEQFLALLEDAVRLQFRSDVPVGLNLSAGIDSASLYYFAKKVYRPDTHTFTAGIEDEEFNEAAVVAARLSNEEKQTWHTATLHPREVFALAEDVMAAQDEPYGGMPTIQYFNLYRVATAPTSIKVVLEGQGVDEALAGYEYYAPDFYRDAVLRGDLVNIKRYFDYAKNAGIPTGAAITTLFRYAFPGRGRSQDFSRESGMGIVAPALAAQYGAEPPRFPRPFSSALLNHQYQDIRYTKLPRVLRFNDRVSMAFGKELRVPFLDHRLMEFMFFLPGSLKIRGTTRKLLLRKAMKECVPEAVRREAQTKKTFGAFQTEWFRKHFEAETRTRLRLAGVAPAAQAHLASPSFRSRPYFDHRVVEERVNRFFRGEGSNSFFLWQMINLEMWLRKYID